MILTYEAMDAEGRRTHDAVEAPNSKEAVELLRRRGLFVTRIEQSAEPKAKTATSGAHGDRSRLPLKVLALFTRQMAMLLHAGSGVVPAISTIARQMKKPVQADLLRSVVTELEDGTPLTDAFRKHPRTFDPVYCAIVSAGEASGTLTQMFERLAIIVGRRRAIRKKILGAFAYPALLIVMCVSILQSVLLFVLPRFADMFEQLGVEAPASTELLLATGAAVRTNWMFVLAGIVAFGLGVAWLATSTAGRRWLTNIQLSIPVFGRLRSRLIQAQILRTLGMLLESRVGLLDALELARGATRNQRFQHLFDSVENNVTSGGAPSAAFDSSGLMEPYICQAIRTGEESGSLGEAMTYCADILDESNEELISVVTKLVEPVILIGMGAIVGGVAISLFLPLFDLTSAMG